MTAFTLTDTVLMIIALALMWALGFVAGYRR